MLTLLCAVVSSVWGQEVTIASFSYSEQGEWSTNATYNSSSGGYYLLTSSDVSIVSPSIDWSQYTDITITIAARKYGGPNAAQSKISVSQGTTELASYSPSSTSIVASSALSISPSSGPITISCPGASSNKGCGVQSIVIKGKSSKTPIATLSSISPEALTVGETGSFTLSANFAEGATYTVEWSSNNSTILSVNKNGSYEALSAGTANVTVTVKPNDTNSYLEASKSFAVTVNAAPVTFDFPWSEDFSSNSLEGYTVANGGTTTKLYNENNAGGEKPELLLSKSGGKFEVTIKLNGNYGAMTLTFKANNNYVTVAATGGTLGTVSFSNKLYTIPITVEEGTETLKLTFSNTNSSNVRVDDFKLEKSKAKPGIYFAEESVTVQPNDTEFTGLTLNNPNHLTVTYSSSDVSLASVNETTGVVTIGENEGIVIITATFAGDEEFEAGTASYTINIGEEKGTLERPYTVAEARAAIDANTGVTGVYATGIVSKIVTKYNSEFGTISYNISADGTTTSDQLQAYRGKSYNGANFTSDDDIQVGDVVVVYGNLIKYNTTYEFAEGNQLVSLVRKPSIEVSSTEVNVTAGGGNGTINVEYKNFGDTEIEAEIIFYAENGGVASYTWISAEINSDNHVVYTIAANEGTDARTAYMKVTAMDGKGDDVYSEMITINQAGYVADYAKIPFEFDGDNDDIKTTTGLTQNGLGKYSSSPKLKFDGTGDWLLLKLEEHSETALSLSFDIKGNPASGNTVATGTFNVMISADGETYTELASYTELSDTQTEIFDLAEDVRYIKWIYTTKSSGNVGLGNIVVIAPEEIVVSFNKRAEGYSTLFYGTKNLVIPEGVKAYTYKVGDDGKAVETEYEKGIIPASSAVIVELIEKNVLDLGREDSYPVTFTTAAGSKETAHTDNMLYGFDEESTTVGPDASKEYLFYSLSLNKKKEEGSIGFYWNQPDGVAFEMPAHRAYLAVEKTDANQGVSAFTFDGIGTGINGISTNVLPADGVYTLSGVRVNSDSLQKGIYIVNGKKVVIK